MNSSIIDLIFAGFFIFMAILGYIKGFVTRLYDLVGTIIVIFLSYLLASPIATIIKIYPYQETDIIAAMIGKVINQMMITVLLFIGLFMIKKIIGFLIKPVLKKMTHVFHLTKWLDQCLGAMLGMVEATFISYVLLVFLVIPFVSQGVQLVESTSLAKHVLNVVPDVSEEVIDMTNDYRTQNDYSLETLTKLILLADDLGIIDQQQTQQIVEEHIQKQILNETITLSSSQKEQVKTILEESQYSSDQIQNILSKIDVRD